MGKNDYIKMEDLKEGYTYRISARNAGFGIWRTKHQSFIISRWKFGFNYIFEEYHYDTGAPYGTTKPWEEIEQSPFDPETFIYIDKEWDGEETGWQKKGDKYTEMQHSEEGLVYLNVFEEKARVERKEEMEEWKRQRGLLDEQKKRVVELKKKYEE